MKNVSQAPKYYDGLLRERACTCHPDDNPPIPCQKKYAFSECMRAAVEAERATLKLEYQALVRHVVDAAVEAETERCIAAVKTMQFPADDFAEIVEAIRRRAE